MTKMYVAAIVLTFVGLSTASSLCAQGPGTEMTQIINRLGLGSDCGRCQALASKMDQNGAAWVMQNRDYIANRTSATPKIWATAWALSAVLAYVRWSELPSVDHIRKTAIVTRGKKMCRTFFKKRRNFCPSLSRGKELRQRWPQAPVVFRQYLDKLPGRC